ncbi:MAG: hypothetical protein ACRETY_00705 [Steroidobacteraceae bacterium]
MTRHAYRLVPAFALAVAPAFAATTVENGYEVTRSQTVQQVPHGWVGGKTTDRETRTGNVPDETWGNSTEFVMTIGGWARKCPTAEGVVEGKFEYVITKDDVISDDAGTRRAHYSHRLLAELKGQVDDNGRLLHVDLEGTFTREQDGTTTERVIRRPPIRFTPGSSGEPDFVAMRRTVEVTGNLSFATAVLMAGTYYKAAEVEWLKPNACVEVTFNPPTDVRALGPNQSEDVRVEIRTKGEGSALVARWGRYGVQAKGGIGTVTPDGNESPSDSPHTIRYTASAQPKRGHGFKISALTRAGIIGDAEWHVTDALRLAIEHRIVGRRDTPAAKIGEAVFDGDVRFEMQLAPFPGMPGGFRGKTRVRRDLRVGHVLPQCGGSASQHEEWDVIAHLDAASETLKLEFGIYPENGVGSWTCRGATAELDVYVASEFSAQRSVALSSRSGTQQQFSLTGAESQETLIVTVR